MHGNKYYLMKFKNKLTCGDHLWVAGISWAEAPGRTPVVADMSAQLRTKISAPAVRTSHAAPKTGKL